MSPAPELVIELLDRNHNRTVFHCGIESLDRYLKRQAKPGHETPDQPRVRCPLS
jgi:hypothetical protein